MASEAQRRAAKRHQEKLKAEGKLKYIQIEFYENDMDIYEYVQSHKPTRTFIKQIIREHMENN